jgi:hypothetical protein
MEKSAVASDMVEEGALSRIISEEIGMNSQGDKGYWRGPVLTKPTPSMIKWKMKIQRPGA